MQYTMVPIDSLAAWSFRLTEAAECAVWAQIDLECEGEGVDLNRDIALIYGVAEQLSEAVRALEHKDSEVGIPTKTLEDWCVTLDGCRESLLKRFRYLMEERYAASDDMIFRKLSESMRSIACVCHEAKQVYVWAYTVSRDD